MRIVLIGDYGRSDEGMRRICATVATHVSHSHEVMTVSTKDFCTMRAFPKVRRFNPELLHYLTGPTAYGLIALRAHKQVLKHSQTVSSGLRPYLSPLARRHLDLIRPDWFIAQARLWQQCFETAGSKTVDLPNPVDTSKFRPVTIDEKRSLRANLGIETDKPIVLHVGHIRASRNLDALIPLQESGRYQVMVIGSESFSKDANVRVRLERAGCRVITKYQPDIEHIYQLADCYAFPVLPPAGTFPVSYDEVGCIDLPLSILEALACGLPVVATKHDAARFFLEKSARIEWFDGTADGCAAALARLDMGRTTTALPEQFDSQNVCKRLDEIYDLVGGRSSSRSTHSEIHREC